MIKEYKNGDEFLKENLSYLELNPYMTSLIIVDAKVLREISLISVLHRAIDLLILHTCYLNGG